jgi:hypothetical protein
MLSKPLTNDLLCSVDYRTTSKLVNVPEGGIVPGMAFCFEADSTESDALTVASTAAELQYIYGVALESVSYTGADQTAVVLLLISGEIDINKFISVNDPDLDVMNNMLVDYYLGCRGIYLVDGRDGVEATYGAKVD